MEENREISRLDRETVTPWDPIENRESHRQTVRVGIQNIKHDHTVSPDGIATRVKQFLRQKKSSFSGKYKHLQATDWLFLESLYNDCTSWARDH